MSKESWQRYMGAETEYAVYGQVDDFDDVHFVFGLAYSLINPWARQSIAAWFNRCSI